uniref:Uncharacterized protein n=1 Tax=Amphimedon queenslandica TaxID=400682 RepID=A0A1X7UEF7_AMPQE
MADSIQEAESLQTTKSINEIYSQAALIVLIGYIWYYCRMKSYYTKRETVRLALETSSEQLLRTSDGRIYKDSVLRHAIEVFTDSTRNPETITRLWIKNPPCRRCCSCLVKLYPIGKPTVYIGMNSDNNDSWADKEGLKLLIKNGFKLKVWTQLNIQTCQDIREGKRELRRLRNEVEREQELEEQHYCNIL